MLGATVENLRTPGMCKTWLRNNFIFKFMYFVICVAKSPKSQF